MGRTPNKKENRGRVMERGGKVQQSLERSFGEMNRPVTCSLCDQPVPKSLLKRHQKSDCTGPPTDEVEILDVIPGTGVNPLVRVKRSDSPSIIDVDESTRDGVSSVGEVKTPVNPHLVAGTSGAEQADLATNVNSPVSPSLLEDLNEDVTIRDEVDFAPDIQTPVSGSPTLDESNVVLMPKCSTSLSITGPHFPLGTEQTDADLSDVQLPPPSPISNEDEEGKLRPSVIPTYTAWPTAEESVSGGGVDTDLPPPPPKVFTFKVIEDSSNDMVANVQSSEIPNFTWLKESGSGGVETNLPPPPPVSAPKVFTFKVIDDSSNGMVDRHENLGEVANGVSVLISSDPQLSESAVSTSKRLTEENGGAKENNLAMVKVKKEISENHIETANENLDVTNSTIQPAENISNAAEANVPSLPTVIPADTCVADKVWKITVKQEVVVDSNENLVPTENSTAKRNVEDAGLDDLSCSSRQTDVDDTAGATYHFAAFQHIYTSVMEDSWWEGVISRENLSWIHRLSRLSGDAQKFFVRILCRKHTWISATKMKYAEVGESIDHLLVELKTNGFLETSEKISDLQVALNLCSAPILKSLAKEFKLDGNSTMEVVKQRLVAHTKRQSCLLGDMSKVLMRRLLQSLSNVYRIPDAVRFAFLSLFHLYSLPDMCSSLLADDPNLNLLQNLIFKTHQANSGLLKLPDLSVYRVLGIFRPSDLESYIRATEMEAKVLLEMKRHNFVEAIQLCESSIHLYRTYWKTDESKRFLESLPRYLRRFTAAHVMLRTASHMVDGLQKAKDFDRAVVILKLLLDETADRILCGNTRWRWHDRLALNFHCHLKEIEKAYAAISMGLEDPAVPAHGKLLLYERGTKVVALLNKLPPEGGSTRPYPYTISGIHCPMVIQPPVKNIEGSTLRKGLAEAGRQNVFVSTNTNGGDLMSVERVALEHYAVNEGYVEGIHGENSTFTTLFGILCWAEIFPIDIFLVPNVVYGRLQTEPLDLNYPEFFQTRRHLFERKFFWFTRASVQDVIMLLRSSWNDHCGTEVSFIDWKRFEDISQAERLVSCIGPRVLGCLFKYLVSDNYRHKRSGMPDLTVWNYERKTFKVVEVKGPGDKLSTKQILWLNVFLSWGVSAEVCHVKGVRSNRLAVNFNPDQD